MPDMRKNRNLLVLHQGALGDLVLTFPAFRKVRMKYSRIDAICRNQLGKLAEYLHIFDKCFPLESSFFTALWADDAQADSSLRLFFAPYDAVLLFSFSAALEISLRKIAGEKIIRIPSRPKADLQVPVSEYTESRMKDYGFLPEGLPDGTEERFSVSDRPNILIHPGSGSPRKNWPFDRFLRLFRELKKEGAEAEFIFGPAEISLSEYPEVKAEKHRIISDILEITKMMENTEAGLWIGNDSGLTHLAAYTGLSVIAVFGPSDPKRWKPVGNVKIIQAENPDCRPCFEIKDKNCETERCLHDISVADVKNAVFT